MKTVYVITMWSGGRPAKKWKSDEAPQRLPEGTGVSFVSAETKLGVQVIGSLSIEQYESGKEEFETRISREAAANTPADDDRDPDPPKDSGSNIRRLF